MSEYIIRGPKKALATNFNQTLGKIIIEKVSKRPDQDRVFLVEIASQKELTFKTIIQYTISLASHFKQLGIKEGDVIATYAPNVWQSAIVMLATWYVGAAINPMNFNYTEYELEKYFQLTKPKLVITSKNKVDTLTKVISLEKIIVYEEDDESAARGVKNMNNFLNSNANNINDFESPKINPEELVSCILLSSGTTGLPKAVMLTQVNLTYIVEIMGGSLFAIDENTVTTLFVPLFHVFGVLNFSAVLYHGRKLIMFEKFHPETFLKVLEEFQVTTVFTVPAILSFLVTTPLLEHYNIRSVRHIMCGAAPLTKELEQLVFKKLEHASVRQMYGMTETTGPAIVVPEGDYKFRSIGKPVGNIEIKIVDTDTNELLGPNMPGEILIKGPGNMKGYLGNMEETLKIFDSDKFIYSGDVGYYDEDHHFYIVDRKKELIKYKGFQVSPSELEELISKYPGVQEVVVVGKPNQRTGELATAVVVKVPNVGLMEEEIINYVADHVCLEKQLHGGVIFVTEIPKSSLGKTLRKEVKKLLK